MANILLINPSMNNIYKNTIVRESVASYFPLNLLMVAATLIEKGHNVKLIDFLIRPYDDKKLTLFLSSFHPDFIGITFTTPLYGEAKKEVSFIKGIAPHVIVIGGGPHISSLPEETLQNLEIDIGVVGEGEFKLLEIVEAINAVQTNDVKEKVPKTNLSNSTKKGDIKLPKLISHIKGIVYKDGNKIIMNQKETTISDLDKLPFPAIQLINKNDYVIPHTISVKNPVFPYETSRGCSYGCIYCNKSVFGRAFRVKSVAKVIKELKEIECCGFKEVHIMDDGFTMDLDRAKEICRQIKTNKMNLFFNCLSGIRADKIDLEVLRLMKEAGFYRVSLGVESGSQRIVDNLRKELDLNDVVKVVKMCKLVGMETLAFFMLGLPGETERDLKKTIAFAKKLSPDIVKFDIMIPLPSTPIYNELKKNKLILTEDWSNFNFHSTVPVYKHQNLSWETLNRYLHKSYREFYLSPAFIARRFFFSVKRKCIWKDIKLVLSTRW
jgi:anaerobic magnesium-protoporphyrin IX monomethyl ester cyclase